MMPPCPDFEHDRVEHRHPDGWQLWGVQVWPRLRLVASWYPKDMPYDRPGVFRTPARPHER